MLNTNQVSKIRKSVEKIDDILPNFFAVMGDKNRFRIMKLLTQYGELCVSDLSAILEISVSAVSQHLRVLEMSGFVEGERMGQMMCYKPNTADLNIKKIISLM